MGLEDLRVPVQGLRSDQGLMDTDNIRIRNDRLLSPYDVP
jgi:hypothetical protein